MRRHPLFRSLPIALLVLLQARPAEAASLQPVNNWGATGVPSYISMYIYVPDKQAPNPPILVVSHFCGGSASAVFGQAQSGGIVKAADTYGFIMIFPQTTNPATSAKCWEVGSTKSLTHDGGGDTQAVAQMVKYTVTQYKANANRVYATGDSSGGMMTQALLAVYPDVFKGGSSFAGVAAGCWSAGWSAASNWGGTCAGGNYTQTAQQWGDKVRAMYPKYSGPRPRVQLFHGDGDMTIYYKNLAEGVKEWTNVLGLPMDPTSTDKGLTLGSHQATRQRWQDSCGSTVLEAITSIGGDHGPSDALFNSSYVIPFLALDKTGDVDPVVAACPGTGGGPDGGSDAGADGSGSDAVATGGGPAGGAGGRGGGGTSGTGGRTASGGATGSGGSSGSGGGLGTGGSASGGTTATGGVTASGGMTVSASGGTTGSGSGGASSAGSGGSSTGGASNPGTNGNGAPGSTGCACALDGTSSTNHPSEVAGGFAACLLLLVLSRRRAPSSSSSSSRVVSTSC